MALPNLTGQYIQDTYQRVLQVSGSGDIVDGTGSLFIPPNAISASYATSASHEIIKEVSSSHANFADTASLAYSANTASYVNTLNQDVNINGTLDVDGVISGSILVLNSGSAGVPTINFGDLDTGIYSSAPGYINFQSNAGGSPEMEISSYILMRSYLSMNNNYISAVSRIRHLGEITGSNTAGYPLKITGSVTVDGPLDVNGTTRTLFTSCSLVYSGSNVTQVTQSYEAGTQQITNITYSGSFADGNPLEVSVTGSDGVSKLYTMTYSASLVTQILVT